VRHWHLEAPNQVQVRQVWRGHTERLDPLQPKVTLHSVREEIYTAQVEVLDLGAVVCDVAHAHISYPRIAMAMRITVRECDVPQTTVGVRTS